MSIIFTARVCFHRCLSVNILGAGGYPVQVWMVGGVAHLRPGVGGVPNPGLDGGGYPIWGVGVPQPGLDGEGVPHPRSGGGYPSQVWMVGGYAIQGGGVPQPGLDGGGYPIQGDPGQVWMVGVPGVPPIKTWPGYPLPPGMGNPQTWNWVPPPSRPGQGTPHPEMGYPPDLGWVTPPTIKTWLGYPHPGMGYPPPQETEQHSEHLLRGGSLPLVFTQEDFLVDGRSFRATTTENKSS